MTNTKLAYNTIQKIFEWGVKKITGGKFTGYAEYIGTFLLIYCGLGGGFIAMCLFMGINPTLVVSVVAAPIWIGIVFLTNNLTKIAVHLKDVDDNPTPKRKKK